MKMALPLPSAKALYRPRGEKSKPLASSLSKTSLLSKELRFLGVSTSWEISTGEKKIIEVEAAR